MKLKNILHYIGLLALFITTLLGWLYWDGRDKLIASIIIGVILMFIMFFLVTLMVKKREETHVNLVHVISLWSIYITIAVFGAFLSLHSITIMSVANEDLKNNGNQKLESLIELREIFKDPKTGERNIVKRKLETDISELLQSYISAVDETSKDSLENILTDDYNFDPEALASLHEIEDKQELRNKWIEYNYTDKINDFYSKIEEELKSYHLKNKNTFNDNDRLKIHEVYYDLDTVLSENKKAIEENFSNLINKYGIEADVYKDYKLTETTVSINSLSELRRQYDPITSIAIYLLIHLLILCPFLLTKKKGLKPKAMEDNAMEL
jgi:hypothetical protein